MLSRVIRSSHPLSQSVLLNVVTVVTTTSSLSTNALTYTCTTFHTTAYDNLNSHHEALCSRLTLPYSPQSKEVIHVLSNMWSKLKFLDFGRGIQPLPTQDLKREAWSFFEVALSWPSKITLMIFLWSESNWMNVPRGGPRTRNMLRSSMCPEYTLGREKTKGDMRQDKHNIQHIYSLF